MPVPEWAKPIQKVPEWAKPLNDSTVFTGKKPTGATDTRTSKPVMVDVADPENSAGLLTQFKTGFVDDPKTKMRIYAADRFPEIPEQERLKRYNTYKGEIVYLADDGKWHQETPATLSAKAKRFFGETAARTPSMVMGGIGAAGGPGTAMLGAAGGEGIRKSIGNLVFDEPQTTTGNIVDMGTEAAMEGVGYGIASQVNKGVNRAGVKRAGKLATAAGRNVDELDMVAARNIEKTANKYGIEMFPPQTTQSGELISKFKYLSDAPATSTRMQRAISKQASQAQEGMRQFLNEIYPDDTTLYSVGGKLVKTSQEIIDDTVSARRALAKPFYKKAYQSGATVNTQSVLGEIDELLKTTPDTGKSAAVLRRFRRMLLRKTDDGFRQVDDIATLDNVKKEMDTILRGPEGKSINADIKHRLQQVKDTLVGQMDEVSPDYAEARRVFSDASGVQNELLNGRKVEELSKLKGDKVSSAVGKIFKAKETTPETVFRFRKMIEKKDPDLWRAAVKTHIEETFDGIKASISGGDGRNIPGRFYKAIMGDKKQQAIFKASLDKTTYKNLQDFSEVMRRISLTAGKESATESRRLTTEKIEREAGSRVAGLLKTDLTRPLSGAGDWIDARLFENYSKELADAMLSPKAAAQLQKIKLLKPGTEKLNQALGGFLGLVAGGYFQNEASRSRNDGLKVAH